MRSQTNPVLIWMLFCFIWTIANQFIVSPVAKAIGWLAFAIGYAFWLATLQKTDAKVITTSETSEKQMQMRQHLHVFVAGAKVGACVTLLITSGVEVALLLVNPAHTSSIFLFFMPLALMAGAAAGGFLNFFLSEYRRSCRRN